MKRRLRLPLVFTTIVRSVRRPYPSVLESVAKIRGLCSLALFLIACSGADPVRPTEVHPLPALLAITPEIIAVGAVDVRLELTGRGFTPESRVIWNGTERVPTFINESHLELRLENSETAGISGFLVRVLNPKPGGGSSGEVRVLVGNPVPAIVGVTPDVIDASSVFLQLEIVGSGFRTDSEVRFDDIEMESEWISDSRLIARIEFSPPAKGGEHTVSVRNRPFAGGTARATVRLENAVPTLSAVTPGNARVGRIAEFTLLGSGFNGSSVVRWNGEPVAAEVEDGGVLRVEVPSEQVQGASGTLSVHNPSPGGGSSGVIEVAVSEAPPEIVRVEPASITVGTNGALVEVEGRNFTPGSVLEWNGRERETEYVDIRRLRAAIPASDLTGTDPVALEVFDSGTGLRSRSVGFAVLPSEIESSTTVMDLPIRGNDVVYDRDRSLFYVSVWSDDPEFGGEVIAIDVSTGAVVSRIGFLSEPGTMELSVDRSRLFVNLSETFEMAVVHTSTFALESRFFFGADEFGDPVYAEDIVAIPGLPDAVLVALRRPFGSPHHRGVAVFDGGVRRPIVTDRIRGSNSLSASEEPGVYFGYESESTDSSIRRLVVSELGVTLERNVDDLVDGFNVSIKVDGGRIYSSMGDLIETRTVTKVGQYFPFERDRVPLVEPDSKNGRVHFLRGSRLSTFASHSTELIGELDLPVLEGARTMIRFGENGLVFAGGDRVVWIRSPLVAGDGS